MPKKNNTVNFNLGGQEDSMSPSVNHDDSSVPMPMSMPSRELSLGSYSQWNEMGYGINQMANQFFGAPANPSSQYYLQNTTTTSTTSSGEKKSKTTGTKRKAASMKEEKDENYDEDDEDDDGTGKGSRNNNGTRTVRLKLASFYAQRNEKPHISDRSRGQAGCDRRGRMPNDIKKQASESLKVRKSEFREHLQLYKRLSKGMVRSGNEEGIKLERCFEHLQNDNMTEGFENPDKRKRSRLAGGNANYWYEAQEEHTIRVTHSTGLTEDRRFYQSYIYPKFTDMKNVAGMQTGIYHHLYFQKLRHILKTINDYNATPKDREKKRKYDEFMEEYFPYGEVHPSNENYEAAKEFNLIPTVFELKNMLEDQNPFYPIDPIPHPAIPHDENLSVGNHGLPIALFIEYGPNKPENKNMRKFNGTYGRGPRWNNEHGHAYRKHKRKVEEDFGSPQLTYKAQIGPNINHFDQIVVSEERSKLIKNNFHSVCRGESGGRDGKFFLLIPQYLLTRKQHVVRDDSQSSNGSNYESNRARQKAYEIRPSTSTSSSHTETSDIKLSTVHRTQKWKKYQLTPALCKVEEDLTVYSIVSLMVPSNLMGKLDFQTVWDHSFHPYTPRYTLPYDEFLSHFLVDRDVRDAVDYFTQASLSHDVSRQTYINFMHWWAKFGPNNSYQNLVKFFKKLRELGQYTPLFFFSSDNLTKQTVQGLYCLRPHSTENTAITLEFVEGRGQIGKTKITIIFSDAGEIQFLPESSQTTYESFESLLKEYKRSFNLDEMKPYDPKLHEGNVTHVRYTLLDKAGGETPFTFFHTGMWELLQRTAPSLIDDTEPAPLQRTLTEELNREREEIDPDLAVTINRNAFDSPMIIRSSAIDQDPVVRALSTQSEEEYDDDECPPLDKSDSEALSRQYYDDL